MTSSSSKPLRVAVIGCGRMGAFTSEATRLTGTFGYLPFSHAEAIAATQGLALVALCDESQQALDRARAHYSVDAGYLDYQRLIAEVRPDIVTVATRTPVRCEIIRFAAQHGVRGIYAEKPFSRSLQECTEALDALARADCAVLCGTVRRFMPLYRMAAQIATSGELGNLSRIVIAYGKTLLLWNHPHSIDAILFLSGGKAPKEVDARCEIDPAAIKGLFVDADPIVESAIFRFEHGLEASITSDPGEGMRVIGDRGQLEICNNGEVLRVTAKDTRGISSTREYWARDYLGLSGTQRALLELAAAVVQGQHPSMSPADISLTQRLIFSTVWSHLEQRPIAPADCPADLTVSGRWQGFFA